MITSVMLIGFLAMQIGADDSMFFDRFKDEQSIIYASCRTREGARAIVYYDNISDPDFVEVVNGRVGRMAHLSMQRGKFTVKEASGGLWTIEKVRASVGPMVSLPLYRGSVASLRAALYVGSSKLRSCDTQTLQQESGSG